MSNGSIESIFRPKIAPEELKKFYDWVEEYKVKKGLESFNISLSLDIDPSVTADDIIADVLAMDSMIESGDFDIVSDEWSGYSSGKS